MRYIRDGSKDQLHNLYGLVQNENTLKKLLKFSRWQQQSIKPSVEPFWMGNLWYCTDHTLVNLSPCTPQRALQVFSMWQVLLKCLLWYELLIFQNVSQRDGFPTWGQNSESENVIEQLLGRSTECLLAKFSHIQNRSWFREVVFKLYFEPFPEDLESPQRHRGRQRGSCWVTYLKQNDYVWLAYLHLEKKNKLWDNKWKLLDFLSLLVLPVLRSMLYFCYIFTTLKVEI